MLRGALPMLLAVALGGACRRGRDPGPPARRIVVVTPSLAEIVFALGRGDRVVGVSDYCEHPPEAASKPKVGGLVNPNLERILALRPDLVLVDSDPVGLVGRLSAAGVRSLVLRSESLRDVDRAIDRIGGELGAAGAAGRLRRRIARDLDTVRARVAGRPRLRVLFVVDRRPGRIQDVYAIGRRSFLSEILEVAGGTNVVEADRGAVPLSTEALIAARADVIFDATRDPAGTAPWRDLPSIPAVRTGRLVGARDSAVTIPGPRIPRAAERIERALRVGAER
jgi:iron complex transport system substrate-binding protein